MLTLSRYAPGSRRRDDSSVGNDELTAWTHPLSRHFSGEIECDWWQLTTSEGLHIVCAIAEFYVHEETQFILGNCGVEETYEARR